MGGGGGGGGGVARGTRRLVRASYALIILDIHVYIIILIECLGCIDAIPHSSDRLRSRVPCSVSKWL